MAGKEEGPEITDSQNLIIPSRLYFSGRLLGKF